MILKAETDTDVTDYGVVANIEKTEIIPRNVPILTYTGTNAVTLGQDIGDKDLNVILISAHSSDALKTMVIDLGDNGVFKGNLIIFMSCRTQVTRELAEYMGGVGAVGVVMTDRVIPIRDASKAIIALLEKFDFPASATRLLKDVVFESFKEFGGVISVSDSQLNAGRIRNG